MQSGPIGHTTGSKTYFVRTHFFRLLVWCPNGFIRKNSTNCEDSLVEEVRRLSAIMFTDVVGYTSLSQQNESLALELLKQLRQLVRPLFSKHGGKEVKSIGDALLVEFSSALEAARCAYEIQLSIHESNEVRPLERKLLLRIGVHVGDVVSSEGDIHGDAVNIASRVVSTAEPGGICVTPQVYDQIRNKFAFPIVSLGKRDLKNVLMQTEIYKIILPWKVNERLS